MTHTYEKRLHTVPEEAQSMKMMSYQIENINKKTDIIKKEPNRNSGVGNHNN